MIQINLIPDIKAKYIQTQSRKRIVILSALVISGLSIGIVFILGTYVYVAQKSRLSDLDKDIKNNSENIKGTSGLDKILTVQNQLEELTNLHDSKPVVNRLFELLPQITPNNIQISTFDADYDQNTFKFGGKASNMEIINKFSDTLKFAEFTVEGDTTKQKVFSEVVLSSFGVGGGADGYSYTIEMKFNPLIFKSENKTVNFIVPNIISTRSQTESPNALFNQTNTGEVN